MRIKSIDQSLAQALNFSNLFFLDKCFNQINLSSIKSKQNKGKVKNKSKFQKINKNNTVKSSNHSSKTSYFAQLQSQNPSYDPHINSRIKINTSQLDAFQIGFHKKQIFPISQKSQTNSYTMQQLLKSTSVLSTNKKSPIDTWKTNTKQRKNDFFSSYSPYVSNFSFQLSQKQRKNHYYPPSYQNNNNMNSLSSNDLEHQNNKYPKQKSLKTNKSKSKFQKKKNYKNNFQINSSIQESKHSNIPEPKTSSQKSGHSGPAIAIYPPDDDSIAMDLQYIYPKKNQNQNISLNEKQLIQNLFNDNTNNKQNIIEQDIHQRDTCQLPDSKLQKLIQVEDNKYKQIVLKTLFKHQK